MKTKVDKKGKKRSLSETSLSTKPSQKQENVLGPKKSLKKAKLTSLQNGNSAMGNKVQILKKMYKQKEKPAAKQINIGPLVETKTEKKMKFPVAKLDEKSVSQRLKEKRLKNLKKKLAKDTLHKRKNHGYGRYRNAASITLSIKEIEAKVEEIRSREVLSKRAKKILRVLNRKLRLEKSANQSEKLNITEEKSNKKNKQSVGASLKIAQIKSEQIDDEDDSNVKSEDVEDDSNVKREDDEDDSNMKNEDDEDESNEDQSDTENEESMDIDQFDNENDEDDEENEEDKEDEEDEEDEKNEDIEDDINEKANISKVKKEDVKKIKKQATESLEEQKKMRYILFVGNLPYNVTADELKQHFLTKVDAVTSVRIPVSFDTKKPRGFAYVEMSNSIDLEKGLSLHHTILKKRRINVEYMKSNDKKTNVGKNIAKNNKPQSFQKAKKLVVGNQGKKTFLKKEK